MNLETLEKIKNAWDWFTSKVNYWIDSQFISSYFLAAYNAEQRIDEYLKPKKIKYVIIVEDNSEYYRWLKVVIRVYIDLPFEKSLKMWDDICKVAYKDMSKIASMGVYVSVDPISMLIVSPKETES